MFSRGFLFGVVISLKFVEPSSLVVGDSVLLVEKLSGVCLVCQIRSNGMVSSMTISTGGFRHLLSWKT
jgi:hypothetical protein